MQLVMLTLVLERVQLFGLVDLPPLGTRGLADPIEELLTFKTSPSLSKLGLESPLKAGLRLASPGGVSLNSCGWHMSLPCEKTKAF